MNIENENTEQNEVDPEAEHAAEMDSFMDEVKDQLGIDENLQPIKTEEESETTVIDEVEEEHSEEDTGDETIADDSTDEEDAGEVEAESDSESDEESDTAFREDFAARYGFDKGSLSDHSVEQLEGLGVELDRRALNSLQEREQPQPIQPPQQQFQQQPQQFTQQGQPPIDFEQLRKQAEEGGYEEGFIESLDAVQQQHLFLQQQNQSFIHQQQIQQQQATQESEAIFDKSLDSLGLPGVFGSDRQSASLNGVHFEARRQLYQKAVAFSQVEGQPLTEALVDRVARVLYADQLKQNQKNELVRKAKSQSRKKLGSGSTRTKKPSQKRSKTETGNDEVDSIMDDPEMAAFIEEHGML